MRNLDSQLTQVLDALEHQGRRRHLRPIVPLAAGRVRVAGREIVNFSSNDYLGLSQHPALIERARDWAARYGAGSGASRLVTGHMEALDRLETKLAAAKGTQAAVILASGWQCNASVLPALLDHGLWDNVVPLLFTDRLNHASLHMGCHAAGIRQIRFRHNDMEHLETLLARHQETPGPRIIVTESVFSMDGDVPDLDRLRAIAEQWDALLYVDEAHATGVLGPAGFGFSALLHPDVAMGTFSKGMGSFGAYVAGSRALCDYLVNRASGLIFATALPPATLGAIDAAIDLVPQLGAERARLQAIAAHARDRFQAAGLDTGCSSTQIVPVIVGDENRALRIAAALEEQGLLGIAIRPPTVPQGTSRLRFAFSAAHTDEDVERLISAVITAVEHIL